jgi:hypothetical protein
MPATPGSDLSSQSEKPGYQPTDIPALFSDPSGDPVLRYERFQLPEVKRQIDEVGYCIVKGLVPKSRIDRIRAFWIETFAKQKPSGRVTWSPHLGQVNHIGFSSDKFQHLYRGCDFLWNEPLHAETREVCLRLHALRNLILDQDPYTGLRFTDARYGIFITASYYPGGEGHMQMHNDGVSQGKPLLHSLLPITFKGRDYKEGGMLVVDRKGKHVDVDGMIEPEDAVFYDGALMHSVMPVVAFEGKNLGRVQVFPIPALMKNLEDDSSSVARIPVGRFVSAKWRTFKNQLRIKLGLNPVMR